LGRSTSDCWLTSVKESWDSNNIQTKWSLSWLGSPRKIPPVGCKWFEVWQHEFPSTRGDRAYCCLDSRAVCRSFVLCTVKLRWKFTFRWRHVVVKSKRLLYKSDRLHE
jgi:hypothetical protein